MAAAAATYGSTSNAAPSLPAPPKTMLEACAPYLAEFVGTFALALTVSYCCLVPAPSLWAPLAVGSVLVAMIYGTSKVSGGNLNPAVSFSLGLIGALEWRSVVRYWVAQVIAGMAASSICAHAFAPQQVAVWPKEGYGSGSAFLVELVYSTLLCFVMNSCAGSKRNNPKSDPNQFYPLAGGFMAVAGGYAAGGVSGGLFNPAVAIGLARAGSGMNYAISWGLASLLGGLLAAGLFRAVRAEEYLLPEVGILDYRPRLQSRLFGEFLGTFAVVLTVGLCRVSLSAAVAWASAAALVGMMYSLGDISGGHFNPAVTLAVVLSGREKCSVREGCYYCAAQLLGGTFAGILFAGVHAAGPNAGVTVGLQAGEGYSLKAAGFAELLFTAVVAYAVLACATAKPPSSWVTRQNFSFALAVGLAFAAGGVAAGGVSGGELNPAVSLGVAVGSKLHRGAVAAPPFVNFFVLGLWEAAGGIFAATIFRLTHAGDYNQAPILAK